LGACFPFHTFRYARGRREKEGAPPEVLIQFGMDDVTTRIKKITDDIKTSSVNSYSQISGK